MNSEPITRSVPTQNLSGPASYAPTSPCSRRHRSFSSLLEREADPHRHRREEGGSSETKGHDRTDTEAGTRSDKMGQPKRHKKQQGDLRSSRRGDKKGAKGKGEPLMDRGPGTCPPPTSPSGFHPGPLGASEPGGALQVAGGEVKTLSLESIPGLQSLRSGVTAEGFPTVRMELKTQNGVDLAVGLELTAEGAVSVSLQTLSGDRLPAGLEPRIQEALREAEVPMDPSSHPRHDDEGSPRDRHLFQREEEEPQDKEEEDRHDSSVSLHPTLRLSALGLLAATRPPSALSLKSPRA